MRLLMDLFVADPGNTTFSFPLRLVIDVCTVKATKTPTQTLSFLCLSPMR